MKLRKETREGSEIAQRFLTNFLGNPSTSMLRVIIEWWHFFDYFQSLWDPSHRIFWGVKSITSPWWGWKSDDRLGDFTWESPKNSPKFSPRFWEMVKTAKCSQKIHQGFSFVTFYKHKNLIFLVILSIFFS